MFVLAAAVTKGATASIIFVRRTCATDKLPISHFGLRTKEEFNFHPGYSSLTVRFGHALWLDGFVFHTKDQFHGPRLRIEKEIP